MAKSSARSQRPNFLAGLVLTLAAGILYASFDPAPAGESPTTVADLGSTSVEDFVVPMPPDAERLKSVAADTTTPSEDPASADTAGTAPPAVVDPNQERVRYSLSLLRDGELYLNSMSTYCARFHKQERLGGDLSDIQTIDLKVRQAPGFAVYMRWRNGDRGRQLLYSDDYDDGDMVVKLGGFKGRLLPGIKLNPHGSRALEEARHPVTQAGLLGMIRKMIAHREHELEMGYGVECLQLPNQEFDKRDCLCFLYNYESPEVSKDYRKSLILVDSHDHIPVMVRNYTWAADTENLTAEELDDLTLVENYSFTHIDFEKKLTAVDFSRENPRYRM